MCQPVGLGYDFGSLFAQARLIAGYELNYFSVNFLLAALGPNCIRAHPICVGLTAMFCWFVWFHCEGDVVDRRAAGRHMGRPLRG